MRNIEKIAVIGSGNAGTYFLQHLRAKGLVVKGYARVTSERFSALQEYHNHPNYDLTLICTSDEAIAEVSANFPVVEGIIAHVSGVANLSDIDNKHPHPAVFYPLMSLTPDAAPDLARIPFCIEAAEADTEHALQALALQLGASSYRMDANKRAYLHLAAVVSQNFSNFLFGKAKNILDKQKIDFKLLLPLLQQSLERLQTSDPRAVQTGPAVRGDLSTLQKHLQLIEDDDLKEIYRLLSLNIQQAHDQKL